MLRNCLCLKVLTTFILALVAGRLSAQIGQTYFKYLNPLPAGVQVNDVSFFDNNNGIAVGYYGGILKTTDGGATWQYGVFTFLDNNGFTVKPTLYNCHFVTATIAYAVGEYGLFLKSIDGGMNWTKMDNPFSALGSTSIYPAAVFFTSATRGFMGGTKNTTANNVAPYLYTTNDGGTTWDSIPAPLGDSTYYGAVATPSKYGINGFNKRILSIKFVDANNGYISGSGGLQSGVSTAANHTLLWKYKNGTLKDYSVTKEKLIPHWVPNVSGNYSQFTATAQNFWGIQPANDSLVFLSSQNNGVMYEVRTGVNDSTNDYVHPGQKVAGIYKMVSGSVSAGGAPATAAAQFPINSAMWRMAKGPDGKIYVAYGNGLVNYTSNNGTSWNQINTSYTSQSYTAIDVTSSGKIVTFAGSFITDSVPGQPRRSVYSNFATTGYASTNAMEYADCDNAIAVGGFASLAASTNGGRTWVDKTNPGLAANLFSFYDLSFNQSNKMFASGTAGGNGYVYGSSDMGTTLDLLLTVPPSGGANTIVYGISAIKDSIWVAGRRAKTSAPQSYTNYVFRSFDAGITWDTITVETGTVSANVISSNRVKFTTKDTGYFYGIGSFSVSGKIFKTTDAGATWTNITPATLPAGVHNWTGLSVVGKDTLFACGYAGNVYRSFDAGLTWSHIPVVISTESSMGNLTGILFHDSRNGYTLGNSGRIFITNDGGATWRVDHTPNNNIYSAAAFTSKNVPAGTPFVNRKVLVAGNGVPTGGAEFYEYGNPLTVDIQSTQTVTNATCTTPNGGSITVSASGGIAPYTYSINGGTYQSSNVFTGLAQGTYNVTIKESSCGRTITKPVTVGFTDNMSVSAIADMEVCAGGSVQLDATAPTGSTYSWSPATGLSASNIKNPIATTNPNTPVNTAITYTVTATLGGCVKTDNVIVTIKPSPSVNAGPDKTIVTGDEVVLEGSGSASPTVLSWAPAATVISGGNTYTPTVKPSSTTNYTLTVTNAEGCTSTDAVTVNVLPYCIKVMNAFTPNGDGQNDLWVVTDNGGSCISQVKATVFNRYGSIVYRNDNYNNNWNGTYEGKPVADATYYYILVFKLINGQQVTVKGDVTILR